MKWALILILTLLAAPAMGQPSGDCRFVSPNPGETILVVGRAKWSSLVAAGLNAAKLSSSDFRNIRQGAETAGELAFFEVDKQQVAAILYRKSLSREMREQECRRFLAFLEREAERGAEVLRDDVRKREAQTRSEAEKKRKCEQPKATSKAPISVSVRKDHQDGITLVEIVSRVDVITICKVEFNRGNCRAITLIDTPATLNFAARLAAMTSPFCTTLIEMVIYTDYGNWTFEW